MKTKSNKNRIPELLKKANREMKRLQKLGWTQADFAQALKNLLYNEEKK